MPRRSRQQAAAGAALDLAPLSQSLFLPKEFRQTWDQFPQQMSKLRLSHSFFSAGYDDDEQQRYRHPGEPIITLRRFAQSFKQTMLGMKHTQANTHALNNTHTQTSWQTPQMLCDAQVEVCRHVCLLANAPNMMHSHIQSHKKVIKSTSTEKR